MGSNKYNSVEHARTEKQSRYARISSINGKHPYKKAVEDGYIDYRVRTRHGGEVFYFNFELAKEMGLIALDHTHVINKELIDVLLDTFSIQIINEYDVEHHIHFPENDIRPNKYMATRYLQLQHPNKQGATSGDGRSIWNGYVNVKNTIWDISSCGTGATSLSPATAIEGKNFKTGDKNVFYGCGKSGLYEGLIAAINSEIFHHNGVTTERTLCVIKYRDGTSVNVRTAKNLLRPAHILRFLKRGDYDGLKGIVDYYIDRQIANKLWPGTLSQKENYQYLLNEITDNFAQTAAKFESDYVFCWLDWDGDNIMMDGGVIDYGSIRQFGMYHRDYRYDDVERMSTTISEQKHQAKYIVQLFAQLVDFLQTGKKKNIKTFRKHNSLKEFNKIFKQSKETLLLYQIGFDIQQIEQLYNVTTFRQTLGNFSKAFSYFERIQSCYGVYETNDGVTSDAIFCMRDILRELPLLYLQKNEFVDYPDFIEIIKSEYAQSSDVRLYPSRKRKIRLFQKTYRELISLAAKNTNNSEIDILKKISDRSSLINRYERVTGDAVISITNKMIRVNKELGANEMYRILRNFIEEENLVPEHFSDNAPSISPLRKAESKKALQSILKMVKQARSGI